MNTQARRRDFQIGPAISEWHSQKCELEGLRSLPLPLSSFPFSPILPSPTFPVPLVPSLPFPSVTSPPLRRRTPKTQLGGLGEHCELPQRGLGGAPAEIEFGAF